MELGITVVGAVVTCVGSLVTGDGAVATGAASCQNMLKEKQPVLIPGKIKSMEPAANAVLEMLKPINSVLVTTSSGVERAVADNQLDGNILRLLKLAGFSEQIYVTVNERLACELS